MAKSKKSKILAMALCASVMTGIYAAPVMAADVNANFDSDSGNIVFTIDGDICRINKDVITEAIERNSIHSNGSVTANAGFIARSGYFAFDGSITANAGFIARGGYFAFVGDTQYAMLANKEYFALGDDLRMNAQDNEKRASFYVDNATGNVTTKGDVTTLNGDGKENYTLNTIGANTAGIERIQNSAGNNITEIENTLRIYDNGTISTANSKFKINNQGTVFANAVNVAENAVVISEDSINAFHNKFTVNTDGVVSTTGINVAKDMFTASAGGVTMASGNMKVDTAGNIILADKRKVDGVDVSELKADFDETNGNVGGITRSEGATAPGTGTTTIEDTLSVSKNSVSANVGKNSVNVNNDYIALKSNGNGVVINGDGVSTIAGKHSVTTDGFNGTTFTNGENNGETVINGGSISTKELTVSNGTTYVNANEEGITLTSNGAGLAINEDGLTGNMGNASFNLSNNNYNVTVGNSTVTVNGNGTTFTNGENNGETVINGNSITTETLNVENIKLGNSMTDKDGNTITIGAAGVIDIKKDGNTVFRADTDNFEAHYDNYDLTLDGKNGFALSNETSSFTLKGDGFAFAGPVNLGAASDVKFGYTGNLGGYTGGNYNLSQLVDTVNDIYNRTDGIYKDADGDTVISNEKGTWNETNKKTKYTGEGSKITIGDDGTTFENGEGNGTTNINGSEIVSDATNVESGSGSGSGFGGGTSTTNGDNAVYEGEDGDSTHVSSDGVTIGDKTNTNTTNIDKDGMVVNGSNGTTHISDSGMTVTGENGTNNISDSGMTVTGSNGTTNISGGDISVDNSVTVAGGSENKTTINNEGITVGDKGTSIKNDSISVGDGGYIGGGDVVSGDGVSLNDTAERVGHLENRVGELEDRIDKVGAMAAAIANLRTMGYDPAAPTEVAVGIGQYRDETGAALGLFHYPNRDFMLSLSVSTSGDEVMGGIGATWKFGRKSPEKVAEIKKAQAEADARRAEEAKLAKAEEMKQAAKEAKIKAQQERHAKLAAERAAQAEAAK